MAAVWVAFQLSARQTETRLVFYAILSARKATRGLGLIAIPFALPVSVTTACFVAKTNMDELAIRGSGETRLSVAMVRSSAAKMTMAQENVNGMVDSFIQNVRPAIIQLDAVFVVQILPIVQLLVWAVNLISLVPK